MLITIVQSEINNLTVHGFRRGILKIAFKQLPKQSSCILILQIKTTILTDTARNLTIQVTYTTTLKTSALCNELYIIESFSTEFACLLERN